MYAVCAQTHMRHRLVGSQGQRGTDRHEEGREIEGRKAREGGRARRARRRSVEGEERKKGGEEG